MKTTAGKYLYHIEQPVVERRVERFLNAFEAILKYTNYGAVLDLYARSSTKCNRCSVTCQVYQATGDVRDIPCYRSNLILNVYRHYFTLGGRIRAAVAGSGFLTESHIDEMINAFYRCTACRRCTLECPMGIDHALITHFGRYVLSEMRLPPKSLQVPTREQLEGATKNTSKVPLPALKDTLEFLSDEIKEDKGIRIDFPIDKEGVDTLFFAPVSDYIMEADTLMGIAYTMHAIGEGNNWTIGSINYDCINYGLFYSDWILERNIQNLIAEAKRLRVKRILIGECGHATRSAKYYVPLFGGKAAPPVLNCLEFVYEKFKAGRLKLNPAAIQEKVTYHDPCNISRAKWVVEQPREMLKAFVKNYVEMTPNRCDNYCCGGGGGTVSLDEMHEFRMEIGGRTKMEQLKATGADIVVAPCANCKKQLRELVDYHKLPMRVAGFHDLLYKALEI